MTDEQRDRVHEIERRARRGSASLIGVGSHDVRWSTGLGDAAVRWTDARAEFVIALGSSADPELVSYFASREHAAREDFERRANARVESIVRIATEAL